MEANTDSLLQQGGELMLLGMGTVFVFLAVLVAVTKLMSGLIGRYFPEQLQAQVETQQAQVTAPAGSVDQRTLQVIQAALDQHRGRS